MIKQGKKYKCNSEEWLNFTFGSTYMAVDNNTLKNDENNSELIRDYFTDFIEVKAGRPRKKDTRTLQVRGVPIDKFEECKLAVKKIIENN